MRRRDLTIRAAGLILTGELAVHELRYLIAPEQRDGHGYLPALAAVSVFALAVAAGQLAGRLERARSGTGDDRVHVSFRAAWIGLAAAIALLFCVQESLESVFTGGGESVVAAVAGGGGWVALPLAAGMAALLALALRGADAVVRAATRVARVLPGRARSRRMPVPAFLRRSAGPIARHLAGRAPPLAA